MEFYISKSLPQNLFSEKAFAFSGFMHQIIEHLTSIDHQHALSRLESGTTTAEHQRTFLHTIPIQVQELA